MLHTAQCTECGKGFSRTDKRRMKFCCKPCADIFNGRNRRIAVEVLCAHCGTSFRKTPSQRDYTKKHFCSRSCMGQWQSKHWVGKNNPNGTYNSVDCACAICGKTYTHPVCDIRNGEGKFCSNKCKGVWISENRSGPNSPYWQGGEADYRGANWVKQREEARKRDKYKCQRCGVHESKLDRALDVHHITPFRAFGPEQYEEANQLTNLVSMCRSCHISIEKGRIPVQRRFL